MAWWRCRRSPSPLEVTGYGSSPRRSCSAIARLPSRAMWRKAVARPDVRHDGRDRWRGMTVPRSPSSPAARAAHQPPPRVRSAHGRLRTCRVRGWAATTGQHGFGQWGRASRARHRRRAGRRPRRRLPQLDAWYQRFYHCWVDGDATICRASGMGTGSGRPVGRRAADHVGRRTSPQGRR